MNTQDESNELTPVPERTISDVETLKALTDPMRLRILETMVAAADDTWTVKRLAAALGVGPTKLYHHINVLEEHAFIRVAGTRVVSGIIETSYRIAQLSVRLDRSLLASGDAETSTSIHDVLEVVFNAARDDIERGFRSGLVASAADGDPLRELLVRGLTRLPPARAAELRERLQALLNEFGGDGPDATAPDGRPYGYLITLYPLPETAPTTETTDD